MIAFYSFSIRVYYFFIWIASFFNPKAQKWVNGRKSWNTKLENDLKRRSDHPLIWVHCASLGEFEQGRPVIEGIKAQSPNTQILLTFFSPSGYEIRKNYKHADFIHYLPIDTPQNAKQFTKIARPTLAIFVKYEFWYHHLTALFKAHVPTLLISALFRPDQYFFKPYGKAFFQLLPQFSKIYLQNQTSYDLLQSYNLSNIDLAGDTRVDRVQQIVEQAKPFPIVEAFCHSSPTLVVGSSWPPDEDILAQAIKAPLFKNWKIIFAPHEIKDAGIKRLERLLPVPSIRYSQAEMGDIANAQVLIIDNIGMLASLYQYGKVAYIGGGFGKGIHNTLEPITFRIPVLFGPTYEKFEEARYLVKHQGAFAIENEEEFIQIMNRLKDEKIYQNAAEKAQSYILLNQGATKKILADLPAFIPYYLT